MVSEKALCVPEKIVNLGEQQKFITVFLDLRKFILVYAFKNNLSVHR